jgi:hypothetical protein
MVSATGFLTFWKHFRGNIGSGIIISPYHGLAARAAGPSPADRTTAPGQLDRPPGKPGVESKKTGPGDLPGRRSLKYSH